MPLLPVAKAAPVAGTERAYANANQSLIYFADTSAGTPVAPTSWALMSRSANPATPNYPVLGTGLRSLADPALFPTEANVAAMAISATCTLSQAPFSSNSRSCRTCS
ncbi:MAG: hypothetical protein WDM96_19900 [Lacunisphaera sp.]